MTSSLQVTVPAETRILGKPVRRMEDSEFLTGRARYLDDIHLPGTLHAVFVRSPHAHAKIRNIDTSQALSHSKVKLVWSSQDVNHLIKGMPTVDDEGVKPTPRHVLATTETRHMGEAVAILVADDPYSAQDAAELVEVDYDPLPAVTDPEEALNPNSPKVHGHLNDNVAYHTTIEAGDIKKAFKEADHIIKLELINQRVAPIPLEPRGVVASYDAGSGMLTVWLPTQDPFDARETLAEILGIPQTKVRIVSPHVGGGFGCKISLYPEEVIVSLASIHLKQPVKWVESRRENLLATTHGRGQKQHVKAAVKSDGRLMGLKVKVIADAGAYATQDSIYLPEITIKMTPGAYDIPAYRAEALAVLTNKVPQGAYRGAGRPEATYLIERLMNAIARQLKLDPVKVRLTNFIKKDQFPFKTITGYTYDSGDYEANLRSALQVSKFGELRQQQKKASAEGRLLGIGLATYVEICGFGPNYPQTAAVAVTKNGQVIVTTGTNPQGQGHATTFAQIVAEELGIDLNSITVNYGDTMVLPWGTVTAGSRSAAVAGSAVLISARKIRNKMAEIAAKMLDTDATNMVFEKERIYQAGMPEKSLQFSTVAETAYKPEELPPRMEPTLFEYTAFAPPEYVFPFGTHVVIVEVDKETGAVRIVKYYAMDDCGKVLNPLVVQGQIQGGIVQGLGQALIESIIYDQNGQLLTSTLADYPIPSAELVPHMECHRTETPTTANPLGVKGVGEAGTIASTATIANAVEDALTPYGVVIDRMPLTPGYIHQLIHHHSKKNQQPNSHLE